MCRYTVPELRDSLEPIFKEVLPAEIWNAGTPKRSGGHLESFTFPNGSIVLFRSLQDWNRHRSLNLGFLAYDEMNIIDEETYNGMAARVRQRDITAEARALGYTHEITRRGIFGATNPSGKDWVWSRFHPDSSKRAQRTAMFASTTLDNPYLPPEYVESLLQYPKPWVQRYVLCQFDDFAGKIYEDWGEQHIIPRLELGDLERREATYWMSLDPGTDAPSAGLWVYLDQANRRLIGVAEYEQPGLSAETHARNWRQIEAQHQMKVKWRVADPNSVTQRDRGTMMSLQTQYQQQGFNFNLGSNDLDACITSLGLLIAQKRFVVTQDCPLTFEAIKQYQWKDISPAQRKAGEQPKQKPLKKNTHLVECAQYLSQRQAPSMTAKNIKQRHDDFNTQLHRNIRNNLARKAVAKRSKVKQPGVLY